MEADVGTPIEYNPDEFSKPNHLQNEIDNENEPERDDNYYIPPHQQIYPQHQQMHNEKYDIFANLDKTGYVIIFVAFLLGFFMGKTMRPVILRPG